MYTLDFEEAEEPEIQITKIHWIMEKGMTEDEMAGWHH